MNRHCQEAAHFGKILELGGGWPGEYTSHVSKVGSGVEELLIVFVERVARIHALSAKAPGDLDVLTATILRTVGSRILVRVVESSQRFVAEHVRCTARRVALSQGILKNQIRFELNERPLRSKGAPTPRMDVL